MAQTFNDFFESAVKNLNTDQKFEQNEYTEGIDDPIDLAIHKFKAHPSNLKIKEVIVDKSLQNEFNFVNIEVE